MSPLTLNAPRTDVRAQLAEPGRELVLDLAPAAPTLLVLFAGLAPKKPGPPFEYLTAASAVPAKRAYVRDTDRRWYHSGVRGLGADVVASAQGLIDLARRLEVERVACVGASAGGYAALLFGSLIGADVVHAISPQTFLSAGARRRHGDARWAPFAAALHAGCSEEFLDLEQLYARYPRRTRAVVHYATCDRLDGVHAGRLPGAELRAYELARPERHVAGGHALVFDLRDDGQLAQILLEAAGLVAAPAPGTTFRTGPPAGHSTSIASPNE